MSNQITVEAGQLLDSMAPDIAPLLRENGQSFDRLKSVFLIAVMQEPRILDCTPESLRREISKCAADGLVPDSKEAVLLPYWDSKEKVLLANYQPMVQGIIKRVKELGGVFNIVCKLVHEKDEFILNEADPDSLVHKSDPFAKPEQRGAVVGGYAVFRDDQKRVMHLETMSAEDFQKVRDTSKAPDSPAWKKWTNEMYRKAVLRRGSKYVPINNDKIRALLERQDDMFDFNQPRIMERVNPFTGEAAGSSRAPALEHKSQAPVDQIQGDRGEKHPETGRQLQSKGPEDRKAPRSDERKAQGQDGERNQQDKSDQKKAEKAAGPPSAPPDVSVRKQDNALAVEGVEKILSIALNPDVSPDKKKGILIGAAQDWKAALPDYLHPLLRSCIDITDWSIRQQGKEEPWSAEHASFVHKVKTLLDVEKLNIGRYP